MHKGKLLLLVALSLFLLTTFQSGMLQTLGQTTQGGQGLVRCTAGDLVRAPSECPYTDLCPPTPSSPGTVANCTLNESSKMQESLSQLNSTGLESLSISTDKPVYKIGDIVNITINNTGTDPLTFPNSLLGLQIENSATHEKYPLFAA